MYLITNRHLCSEDRYYKVIEECIKHNVENIIIREKDLETKELDKLTSKVVKLKKEFNSNVNLIINSNLEIYEKYNEVGLHLPFNKFTELVNNDYIFFTNKTIGVSIHTIKEIEQLENIIISNNINVDYILASHIYETKCKEGLEPKGLEFLKEIQKRTKIKVVALGGILPNYVKDTLVYSDDVAVMSTIMKSTNVKDVLNYIVKMTFK